MRPLIGLTISNQQDEKKLYTPTSYTNAIIAAGGTPVLLNMTRDDEMIDQYAALVDGILFSGGDDVDPRYYGEDQLWGCGEVSPLRDEFEIKLLRAVLNKYPEKPILGICRGIQILNVAMGGTLYQDLQSQFPGCIRHQQQQVSQYASHKVIIAESSRLYDIYGGCQVMVNSFHHQAIKDIAPALTITAKSTDGVVEGFEKQDHPYFVGVQWHPERLVEWQFHPEHKALFKTFVDASKK